MPATATRDPAAAPRVPTTAPRVPTTADLTGKVKAPASLLSNNGGGVVSNNGAGVVSNNGAGLISDKGGGYRLHAATPWQAAGGVRVTLFDAAGKQVGEPVTADAKGAFRFKDVAKGEAFVVRAILGDGRSLEALARAGDVEAAVTPASTVALAVARGRALSLATVSQAAYTVLVGELEAGLVRDDALIDLAKPLDSYAKVAAERPAVAQAAAALELAATPVPATSGVEAAGAVGEKVGDATLFATLPEPPSGLETFADQLLVLLPDRKTVMSDAGEKLTAAFTFPFAPSAFVVAGTTAYVYDRSGGRFARFTLGGRAGEPAAFTASGERPVTFSPAPAVTRAAADGDGNILGDARGVPTDLGDEAMLELSLARGNAYKGIPGGFRGAVANGPDTFWVGTGGAERNVYQLQGGKPLPSSITVPAKINDLALGPDGSVYVATAAAADGLYRVKDGVVTSMRFPRPVDFVAVTQDGRLRAVSGSSLFRW